MKRIITLTIIMCSLLLSACDKQEDSISGNGGVINPWEVQLGEQYEKRPIKM